jgi:molybdopterin molybdotransferase
MALIPLEEAVNKITSQLSPLAANELPLHEAVGTALTEEVQATRRLPPFNNSAMDGYALRAEDTKLAGPDSPSMLPVQGVVAAGHPSKEALKPGYVMRIFTGAPMPENADTVVIQENTTALDNQVQIFKPALPGDHIRLAGEDVEPGQTLMHQNQILGPGDIAMLVAQGHTTASVIRKPRVAIIPTGDELVEAGQPTGPGQIANSNGIMLQAMCVELGMEPVLHPIVRDQQEALSHALVESSKTSDLILTIGGVSVGDFDYVLSSIQETGSIDFWKVAIKPGKPLAFGHINQTPIIGLPGNPASAFVCFELFARPALLKLAGRSSQKRLVVEAQLQKPIKQNKTREQFLRARLSQEDTRYRVETASTQGSGQLSSMLNINALVRIPSGHGTINAGQNVSVIALDRYFQG